MYAALTNQIEVTVSPEFLPDRSEPAQGHFIWAYTVEITNRRDSPVQLLTRNWRITDGNGRLQVVNGPGVVGEQPTIGPGDSFRYTSACPLDTPSGIMVGSYHMVDEEGHGFEVAIPAFSLDSPFMLRIMH